jgi:hypothetical protein
MVEVERIYMDLGFELTHWYIKGTDILHREDGPAIESSSCKQWFLNGKRHRADGPAIEWKDGSKEWWLNGLAHREAGPSYEDNFGFKIYRLNGKLCKINGEQVRTQKEFERYKKLMAFT